MDNSELAASVNKLKERIIKIEAGNNDLSETDTRQGLINPLFRSLGWDFSDFDSIKSEVRVQRFNEPVDYAFYSSKKKADKPILLLEAKRLGGSRLASELRAQGDFLSVAACEVCPEARKPVTHVHGP